jgi:hypothetical protein
MKGSEKITLMTDADSDRDAHQPSQFMAMEKLKGPNIIRKAAKHNLREIAAERGADSHIDVARTSCNVILAGPGSAAEVASLAQSLMEQAGVKPKRKDAVLGIEILFSIPAGYLADEVSYFNDALAWTRATFNVPVLSAVVHNDEDQPHCHVLLLPLVDDRMNGSALMGHKTRLQALQEDFSVRVGARYGLKKRKAQKRIARAARARIADEMVSVMKDQYGLQFTGSKMMALRDTIAANPHHLMDALHIKPHVTIKGTFAGLMTKPVKPDQ